MWTGDCSEDVDTPRSNTGCRKVTSWHNEIPAPEAEELALLKQNPAEYHRFVLIYAEEKGVAAAVRDVGCTEKQLARWREDHLAGRGGKSSRRVRGTGDSRTKNRTPGEADDLRAELFKAFGLDPDGASSEDPESDVSRYLHWLRDERARDRHSK